MNRYQLERTEWATRFFRDCPMDYEEAINLALTPRLPVELILTDEAWAGEQFWVVKVSLHDDLWVELTQTNDARDNEQFSGVAKVRHDDFWMDAFTDKQDAMMLCEQMGWVVSE